MTSTEFEMQYALGLVDWPIKLVFALVFANDKKTSKTVLAIAVNNPVCDQKIVMNLIFDYVEKVLYDS